MLTADQLFAHAVGDYVIQSDWMANEKTKKSLAAAAHALSYAVSFLLLTHSLAALAIIVGTHFLIDRFRLARFLVFFKNNIFAPGGAQTSWLDCSATGYPSARPAWLSVWLLIIADNLMHVGINALAIKFC